MRRTIAALVVLPVALLPRPLGAQKPAAPPSATPASLESLDRFNQAVDALTRKVWPSVVQVLVTGYGTRPDGTRGDVSAVVARQRSSGSGFVIDPEGYILTNAHVVSGAQRVEIVLPPVDSSGAIAAALSGRTPVVPARVVGITTEIDLAVLKVDGLKLPALPLASYRELRQGETVFAFGSPSGLRNTLTHGLVSSVARQTDPDSPLIYIQTDAPINPGNSGGPLVNVRGEVVGVNTFILSNSGGNEGLGFAIPSATARTVFRQLRQFGQLRRQEIGMSLQTITPVLASSLGLSRDFGVIVSDVWPRGPAEAGGLLVGDILLSVDGQPAENLPSVNYYFRLRDSTDPVQLMVLRGTVQKELRVTAVEEKSQFDNMSSMSDPEKHLVPQLGILGLEIDKNIAAIATGLRDSYGIIVMARAAGAAGDVPLAPRDIIRSFNTKPVFTLAQLRELIGGVKPGTPVTLQVQREGRLMYVSFMFE